MNKNEEVVSIDTSELTDTLKLIRRYLESTLRQLNRQLVGKDAEIIILRQELENTKKTMEGDKQLFNKLLGDLDKLNNDVEWYKKTYEQRSFLGTVREKLFRKH